MFLKYLNIRDGSKIIRNIKFRNGINLIVDVSNSGITGNNIGKTTVLKLIDFCLGGDKKIIWEDPENKKEVYSLVKEFLIENEIVIELCLIDDINDENSRTVVIERNFKSRVKNVVRNINGKFYKEEEYEQALKDIILSEALPEKPTFRQIISHNTRYKELSLNNTLKTLDRYTSDAEYETLHLFLFGCEFTEGNKKQAIIEDIKQETKFKGRLEKAQTKSAYETTLALINNEIEVLNNKKSNLNINNEFEQDLDKLNIVKYKINKISSEISKLNIRKQLIEETKIELESSKSEIDIQQLKQIYEQSTSLIEKVQKTFENLVQFHNQMIKEKIKYIVKEVPALKDKIEKKDYELKELLQEEKEISERISKSDSFEELEIIIKELNEKYQLKGTYENIIKQLNEVDKKLKELNDELEIIDKVIFSDNFEDKVKLQLKKFNQYFSNVSELLYKEQYALKHDIKLEKKTQKIYKFTAFNTNFSSGKKQGEISCFDIAYTKFADSENIPCLHFILNDKKELMHDNQLVKIAKYVNTQNIQFVASILNDKLPEELNKDEYFILKLSDTDKLFQIEKN